MRRGHEKGYFVFYLSPDENASILLIPCRPVSRITGRPNLIDWYIHITYTPRGFPSLFVSSGDSLYFSASWSCTWQSWCYTITICEIYLHATFEFDVVFGQVIFTFVLKIVVVFFIRLQFFVSSYFPKNGLYSRNFCTAKLFCCEKCTCTIISFVRLCLTTVFIYPQKLQLNPGTRKD